MNRHERRQAARDERHASHSTHQGHSTASAESIFNADDQKAFAIITDEKQTTSSGHPLLRPDELHEMVSKTFDHALLMLRLIEHEHGFEPYRPDVTIDAEKFSLDRLNEAP